MPGRSSAKTRFALLPGHDEEKIREACMDTSSHIAVVETSARYDGWRIVAVCFLVATFGWAFGFYGQSVYVAELHRLYGWPASLISSATTFFYLFGAVLVAFVSEAVRTFGPRNCLLGGVLATAAAALIGQVTTPWQLYAVNVLLAFGWAGTSLGVITNTLGLWFDQRRGMAISLALNGASFGGIIGVPLLVAAIGSFGFSNAMMAAAATMLVLMIPVISIFVGRPPERGGIAVELAAAKAPSASRIRAQAIRDVAFLTVSIAFALVLFAQVGFIVHLIAFLDPAIGREHAAIAVALLTATALVVQREFDPRSFGVLISLITAINQVTYAFGPGVIGLLRDASGSYALPFYGCIGLELVAAMLIMVRGRGA